MKPIKTIVVPTDFSRLSEAAIDYAAALAAPDDALVLIIHVEEPSSASYGTGHLEYAVPNLELDALRERFPLVRPANPAVRYQHYWLKGDAADQIAAFAKQEGADLIVLSSHGRTGLVRLIMGSVAENVMRHAECPVLVVKPRTTAASAQPAGSAP